MSANIPIHFQLCDPLLIQPNLNVNKNLELDEAVLQNAMGSKMDSNKVQMKVENDTFH